MDPRQSFLFVSPETPYKTKAAVEITDFCALRNRENKWKKQETKQNKKTAYPYADLQKKAGKTVNILCQDDYDCK